MQQQLFSSPHGIAPPLDTSPLATVLRELSNVIWWAENTSTKANAYIVLSRQPERPDQKHTPREYAEMVRRETNQWQMELVLIQKLCRHANNLITDEISRNWSDDTKRLAHTATTPQPKAIPFVRE